MKKIIMGFLKHVVLPVAAFLVCMALVGFALANPAPYPSSDPTQLIYQIYIIISIAAYTFIGLMLWWICGVLEEIKELLKKKPKLLPS